MLQVALFRPEIPPNTGNAMRLCANTATRLHLIHPLGFELDDTRLRRAGLDYREWAEVVQHEGFDEFVGAVAPARIFAFTRDGATLYSDVEYSAGDVLLFGPESTGLPQGVADRPEITATVRIPMVPRSRSLNLSNALAIAVYEAGRQLGFPFTPRP